MPQCLTASQAAGSSLLTHVCTKGITHIQAEYQKSKPPSKGDEHTDFNISDAAVLFPLD